MKKKLKLGIVLSLLFGFTQAFAWTKVYHHDENGNRLSGDFQTLIDAAKADYDIKFAWGDKVVVKAQTVWIQDGHVTAMSEKMHASDKSSGIRKFFNGYAYFTYILVDTRGNFHSKYYYVNNSGQNTYHDQTQSVEWFVKY